MNIGESIKQCGKLDEYANILNTCDIPIQIGYEVAFEIRMSHLDFIEFVNVGECMSVDYYLPKVITIPGKQSYILQWYSRVNATVIRILRVNSGHINGYFRIGVGPS